MNETNSRQSRFNFLGNRQKHRVISGYQVSDVHSTQPLEIAAGSTLVGNVFAPEVYISGFVYGVIVAKATAVYKNGQLWGDLFTVELQIEDGGKINGWVGTLTDEDYVTYSQELRLPEPDTKATPEEAAERNLKHHDEQQLTALRLLQTETAVALAARAEIEQSFDIRLSELAGKISANNNRLKAELSAASAALAALRPQVKSLQEELQAQKSQNNNQTNELSVARGLLATRQQALDTQAEELTTHQNNYKELQATKLEIEENLRVAQEKITGLSEKQQNLETALQARLAHATDLQESLLRWQELAEFNESEMHEAQEHVKHLQNELDQVQALLINQDK